MPYPESLGPDGLLRGRIESSDSVTELFLAGELDLATADALEARLTELGAVSGREVILDCGELEFLGSTGIRTLLVIHDHLSRRGGRLVLRNLNGAPRQVLELTATLERFNVR